LLGQLTYTKYLAVLLFQCNKLDLIVFTDITANISVNIYRLPVWLLLFEHFICITMKSDQLLYVTICRKRTDSVVV